MTGLRRSDLIQLVLIVCVAAALRFHRSDVVEYFHDDAMLTTLALELVDGMGIPTTGILSSTGIPNSPVSVYIMAIPYSLSADPQFAVHFVMLLNVIGVGLLWMLARIHFGLRAAFVAGMVYAINPWAVLFSRKIWAQEIHTPFILLGLLLLLHGFWQRRDDASRRFSRLLSQTLSLPILLFGLQIHFAAWALLPVIPLVIWQGRRQISWRATVLGILLSILILLPYARGLSQTLDSDPYRISDAMQRSLDKSINLKCGIAGRSDDAGIGCRFGKLAGARSDGGDIEPISGPVVVEHPLAYPIRHRARYLLSATATMDTCADNLGFFAYAAAGSKLDAGLYPLFHTVHRGICLAYRLGYTALARAVICEAITAHGDLVLLAADLGESAALSASSARLRG